MNRYKACLDLVLSLMNRYKACHDLVLSLMNRYKACHDLVLSRFCAIDYRDFGIIGIKIHRITRCHNRMLKMNFDNKVSLKHADDDEGYQVSSK